MHVCINACPFVKCYSLYRSRSRRFFGRTGRDNIPSLRFLNANDSRVYIDATQSTALTSKSKCAHSNIAVAAAAAMADVQRIKASTFDQIPAFSRRAPIISSDRLVSIACSIPSPFLSLSLPFERTTFASRSQRVAFTDAKFRGRSHPDFIIGKSPRSNYCRPTLCIHNEG